MSLTLSGYVCLICLFSPKIYIILRHPDKNVRKLTMNSGTYKKGPTGGGSGTSGTGTSYPQETPPPYSPGPSSSTPNRNNLPPTSYGKYFPLFIIFHHFDLILISFIDQHIRIIWFSFQHDYLMNQKNMKLFLSLNWLDENIDTLFIHQSSCKFCNKFQFSHQSWSLMKKMNIFQSCQHFSNSFLQ